MKYVRGNQTWITKEAAKTKMRFDDGDFVETPWGAVSPDGKEVALLNHALVFYPFFSWGAVFDGTNVNFTPYLEKKELTLLPEAYDYYLENGRIDSEGNYIWEEEEENETT